MRLTPAEIKNRACSSIEPVLALAHAFLVHFLRRRRVVFFQREIYYQEHFLSLGVTAEFGAPLSSCEGKKLTQNATLHFSALPRRRAVRPASPLITARRHTGHCPGRSATGPLDQQEATCALETIEPP